MRAFTYGYDLFHPSRHVLWHFYTRAESVKHWGDHQRVNGVTTEWFERDRLSREKLRRLFANDR